MATRHSPSADTERPAPRTNAGGALADAPFSLRAPRPMSWPSAAPGRLPAPLARAGSSLPPPPRLLGAPVLGPGSVPPLPIRDGSFLPQRSRRVLWGIAAFVALTAGVLIANWHRSRPNARATSFAVGADIACSPLGSTSLASVPPPPSASARMTACWGPAVEPPVISVWELPAVHAAPPAPRRYGFHASNPPAPPRSILATGGR